MKIIATIAFCTLSLVSFGQGVFGEVEPAEVISVEAPEVVEVAEDEAPQPPKIYGITPVPNGTITYAGNLSDGTRMSDLSWAWSSQNTCFPETQKSKFTGNHIFFTGIVPKYSELVITVVPDDPSQNFSVYAYEIGENSNDLVPNLPRCVRCEAEHKWDRPKKGKTQDHTRIVNDILALGTPYRVVIGVTGADGLAEGAFTLKIEMKTR